jgi:hypothetical protein
MTIGFTNFDGVLSFACKKVNTLDQISVLDFGEEFRPGQCNGQSSPVPT